MIVCFFLSSFVGMTVAFAEEDCTEEEEEVDLVAATRGDLRTGANKDLGRVTGRESWPEGRCGAAGAAGAACLGEDLEDAVDEVWSVVLAIFFSVLAGRDVAGTEEG